MKQIKTLKITLALGLISLALSAQKTIEQNINYNNQYIEIDVKFASDIEIKTWNKPTVYFKAEISTYEGNHLDLYDISFEETTSNIKIESKTEKLFKQLWKDREKKSGKTREYFVTGEEYQFNYTVYIPQNAKFKLSSINGDLKSEIIEGDFTAELINGNIDIAEYSGTLDLRTINGEIDLKMTDANLVAETIHGDIYADEKLKFEYSDRHVGSKISGITANGKNRLKLNTINGNMYLRY